MSAGLGYDLRTCSECGALYDHVGASWEADECGDCRSDTVTPEGNA